MVSRAHWSVSGTTKLCGCFILVLGAALLVLPCEADDEVRAAAKTALTNVTVRSLGKLYKVRAQAETPERREMVIKACVAGLYAVGDTKNAAKVKESLDGNDFLGSFTSECERCGGDGTVPKQCFNCKGSGACQNRKCSEGVVTSAGFDGRSNARKCSTCCGSGKCSNCKGSGNVMRVCGRCNGSKRIINSESAMSSCQELLEMLVAENKREGINGSETGEPVQAGELGNNKKNVAKRKPNERCRRAEAESLSEVMARGCANNKSGTHKLFQEYEFDFAEYFRWKDRDTTSIQKNRIFEDFFRNGFESRLYKDYVRVGFALVPDGLSFVVSDVQEISFRTSGVKAYRVKLELLNCDSGKNRRRGLVRCRGVDDHQSANNGGESRQNGDLLRHLDDQRLFKRRVSLLVPEQAEEVCNWQKGKVIVSDGWVYDIEIIDAIVTYNNGAKAVDRRMGFGYGFCDYVFRSMAERASFEGD